MGKRLHIISINEQQIPTQMDPSSEQTLSEQSYSQEESESVPKASASKKVRGHTKKQAIWDLESNERIVVNFDETSQPVGEEAKDFTRFLGTLVRMPQHVGIDIEDWRKVPNDKKENLWNIVKEKFAFAPVETEEIKNWVMYDMGVKWKSWKYDLKRNSYDPVLSIDEIVAGQTDSRVDKTQFKTLVTSWFDEKTQEESEKNKVIRSKLKEPHITGTKSFARIIHEETIKNNGVRPSRGTIYCLTRTPKDGRIVNDSVTEVMDKLKNISDASPGSSGSSSVAGGVLDWTTDDLAQVKGRERGGRIRCIGKVVMPKGKGSCSLQDPQVPVLKTRIHELEGEVKELREKQVAMDQFMAIVK